MHVLDLIVRLRYFARARILLLGVVLGLFLQLSAPARGVDRPVPGLLLRLGGIVRWLRLRGRPTLEPKSLRFGFLEQFLIKILDLFVVFDLLLIRLVHFLEFHLLGGELPHRHLELPQFLRRAGLRVLFLLKLVLVEAAILF